MANRLQNYLMRDGQTRLGQAYFNAIWADIDARIDMLERLKVSWSTEVNQLRDLGLTRIDLHIRPVLDDINQVLDQAQQQVTAFTEQVIEQEIQPLLDGSEARLASTSQLLSSSQQLLNNLQTALDQSINDIQEQVSQSITALQEQVNQHVDSLIDDTEVSDSGLWSSEKTSTQLQQRESKWSIEAIAVNAGAALQTRYLVDTSAGAVTLTLPDTPSNGDKIGIVDATGSFGTHNCVINRNGKTIMGLAENMNIDIENAAIDLIYFGGDWRVF
ncbi:hypothetical protein [Marinobacterium iners]|uniref:Uncharacterized protein n=1 Tax=Marinobacterium iners DSM 11526 TaxID=1122198 RepID=A0A1H3ZWX8_9GAMM|nr:hypothetical protein [Marinobacterium iners]SEA28199.1 hypothetical protein SAMN02745729_102197 [Marinobacterium iners DSM 11526]